MKSAARKPRTRAKGRIVADVAVLAVRAAIAPLPLQRDLLIEHLHALQDHYGSLQAAHLVALASLLKLAPVEVYEVATFYHHFDVQKEGDPAPAAVTVRVCDSISCSLAGAGALISGLRAARLPDVRIQAVPCVGRCDSAPVAIAGLRPVLHASTLAVQATLTSDLGAEPLPSVVRLDGYLATGGYTLLLELLAGVRSADSIIDALDAGGLRGLGGAGFGSGRKWRIVRAQPGPRYLCVNLDEGEPGTFKDRHILETDPHRILEGALIAAHVVGCDHVYFYSRDEYAAIRAMLAQELDQLRAHFREAVPTLHLRRGAGAYVCGEESAMIESIEGKRGLPRLRPPYVAEHGLFGRPTLVHNGETLWWVRDIVQRGTEWFPSHGRNGRKGLRRFSVSGRVRSPGVKLAPAGITLRELVDEFCGGMLPGHTLYAYFPGGASGGILPASLADLPLDFDTLQPHGSFIGSAAIIVLGQTDSARVAAVNAMRFFRHESCGQCTPCRVGTAKSAQLMEQKVWDLPLLEDVARVMVDASICGLGQAAPNPMRSVANYFAHELNQP